jgi:ABC-type multidrug transport system ATPase subunit
VRILRRDADRLGFSKSFTIYDTSDSQSTVKKILKDLDLDEKLFAPRYVLSVISKAKDGMVSPADFAAQAKKSFDVRRERIAEVEDIFGLKPVEDNLVNKLSGGQKKRLSISMEMLSSPSLFILDEPDSGLDGVMARELFEQLRKIADSGKIVIVITHTPDRVIDLFDDVIVLAKDSTMTGRLAFYGSIEQAREFFGKEKMEEIVKTINRKEEGGDGLADEYVLKYAEVQYG